MFNNLANIKRSFKKAGLSRMSKYLSFLDDTSFTRIQFLYKFRRLPRLNHPITFNEKLQWLKLNYRDPLITKCANKSTVREYVCNQYSGDILIPQIAEFSSGSDFKLSEMPKQFVMKAAHASGWNYICSGKNPADEGNIRSLIDSWLREDFSSVGREWVYRDSRRVTVCEEFLDGGGGQVPRDYKFFCFHGTPRFVQVDYDRFNGHARTLYDMNWAKIPCALEYTLGPDESGRPPSSFAEMIEIAMSLAAPFPFVRVDLYEAQSRPWFGELTFFPGKACERFNPPTYDEQFGMWLDLKL
jgi:hypothetical protein